MLHGGDRAHPHHVVRVILAFSGAIGVNGLLSVFENHWEPFFDFGDAANVLERVGARSAAKILTEAIGLFPEDCLDDLERRRGWAWGRTPGSEHVPATLDRMESPICSELPTIDRLCVCYAIDNAAHFPLFAKELAAHLKL
jgi:hypothetical protein